MSRLRHRKQAERRKAEEREEKRRGGKIAARRHHDHGEVDGARGHRRLDRPSRKRGGGTHAFRTPSGDVSVNARREARSHGDAMPGGRFPIRNRSDLAHAKRAFGRAKDKPAVRRWIDERAKQLGAAPLGGDVGK